MKYELLLPAGDIDRLKIALLYGADAVYIGGYDYSLRANANNFSIDEIKESVKFAHDLNKKVYVTVNMVFHNEDLEGLDKYLKELDKIGVDSLIISDFAVIESIQRQKLNIKYFISTQKSITNFESALFYKNLGAYRVVLARECTRDDIIDIKEKTGLEVEVFIHGAMCTSYSGRCVMSNYVTKRDSNRGGCAQICRFSFDTDEEYEYNFASKDLNMIDYLPDMMKIGIESYKIEGRMKSMYYIATVTNAYRTIMDKVVDGSLDQDTINYYKKILNRVSNRENTPQFYGNENDENIMYYSGREEYSNQDFLALVLSYDKENKCALIEQRNKFSVYDEVEVFGPNTPVKTFKIEYIKNEDGDYFENASHPQEKLYINIPFAVNKWDIIRVKIS